MIEHNVISIGLQSGGPENGGLSELKVALWRCFARHCRSTYAPAVVHYALILRVGGSLDEFGNEQIEKIRRSYRDRDICAEIIIPQAAWRARSRNQLRDYLAQQVRFALQCCVARLQRDKESVDEIALFAEIDAAIREFRQTDYERTA